MRLWPITIQAQQTINTVIFNLVGIFYVQNNVPAYFIPFNIFISILIHYWCEALWKGPNKFRASWVTFPLASTVILISPTFTPYAVSIATAILFKYISRSATGEHKFNPSNVAALVAVLFFPEVQLAIGYWRSSPVVSLTILFLGIAILLRQKTLTTVFVYWGLKAFYQVFIGGIHYKMALTGLLSPFNIFFSFFILNDPQSIPVKLKNHIIYVVFVFLVESSIRVVFPYFTAAPPTALFITSMIYWGITRFKMRDPKKLYPAFAASLVCFVVIILVMPNRRKMLEAYNPTNVDRLLEKKNVEIFKSEKIVIVESQKYKKKWGASEVVSMPLNSRAHDKKEFIIKKKLYKFFELTGNALSGDFLMHSSISSGDINHDGLLDVALAHPRDCVKMLLNSDGGNWAAMTPFEKPICNVDSAVLADLNSDSFLDLLVVYNSRSAGGVEILLFDSQKSLFVSTQAFDVPKGFTTGGVSLVDFNRDNFLDFYVIFGRNYAVKKTSNKNPGVNKFFISKNGKWFISDEIYGDKKNANYNMEGMTALFTDINNDRLFDLLIANDAGDPSLIYFNKADKLHMQKTKGFFSEMTLVAMGANTVDVDNDGKLEIYVNGYSSGNNYKEKSYTTFKMGKSDDNYSDDMTKFIKDINLNEVNCSNYINKIVAQNCGQFLLFFKAIMSYDYEVCKKIDNDALSSWCEQELNTLNFSFIRENNRPLKDDMAAFTTKNVLLKLEGQNFYENVLRNSSYGKGLIDTGLTWSAFPYDIDNNGYLDFGITKNALYWGHSPYDLVFNFLGKGKGFINESEKWQTDYAEEYRGQIVADFDNDCDGDIFLNNFLGHPLMLDNLYQGNCLQVELRSKSNYYAIGSRLTLIVDGKPKQLQESTIGGIWDSYRPSRFHFGIPQDFKGKKIDLEVLWPNNEKEVYPDLKINYLHIIYSN